jgi:hypothetical protein
MWPDRCEPLGCAATMQELLAIVFGVFVFWLAMGVAAGVLLVLDGIWSSSRMFRRGAGSTGA